MRKFSSRNTAILLASLWLGVSVFLLCGGSENIRTIVSLKQLINDSLNTQTSATSVANESRVQNQDEVGRLVDRTIRLRVLQSENDWKAVVVASDTLCTGMKVIPMCLWIQANAYEDVANLTNNLPNLKHRLQSSWQQLDLGSSEFWTLAQSNEQVGQVSQAKNWYERASMAMSETAKDWYYRGLALKALGWYSEALTNFHAAIDSGYPSREPFFAIGKTYEGLGDISAANSAYDHAIASDSHVYLGRSDVLYAKGWLATYLMKPNNVTLAMKVFERSIKVNDFSQGRIGLADAYFQLGHTHFHFDDFTAAKTSYRKAIEIEPYTSGYYVSMGVALLRLGEREQAENAFRKAITMDSHQFEGMIALADMYRESGDTNNARIMYLKALTIAPTNKGIAESLKNLE